LVTDGFEQGDIINFGSGTQTTNLEVLQAWQRVTGRTDSPVDYRGGQMQHAQRDAAFWCCDTSYAFKRYGFKTEFALDQGIEKFIKEKQNVAIRN
jgi:nucleoside-diphosphate-sugar epimerase